MIQSTYFGNVTCFVHLREVSDNLKNLKSLKTWNNQVCYITTKHRTVDVRNGRAIVHARVSVI